MNVAGVGPEAPTVTNEHGAKQSGLPYRADLLPPHALLDISAVLKQGADKYGLDNWHGIATEDHLNHALVHILAWLAGDAQDCHLAHAACRMLMALEKQHLQQRDWLASASQQTFAAQLDAGIRKQLAKNAPAIERKRGEE